MKATLMSLARPGRVVRQASLFFLAIAITATTAARAQEGNGRIDEAALKNLQWRAIGPANMGGRISDIPGRREFSVVDMTRLEEAYNQQTGSFDFRKFIIYRKRIQ